MSEETNGSELNKNYLKLNGVYPIAQLYGGTGITEEDWLGTLYITKDYECKKWVKVYLEDPNDNTRTFKQFALVDAKPLQFYLRNGFGVTTRTSIRENIPIAIAVLEGDVVEEFEDIEVQLVESILMGKENRRTFTVKPIAKLVNGVGIRTYFIKIMLENYNHPLYGRAKETHFGSDKYICKSLSAHFPSDGRDAAFNQAFAPPEVSVEYIRTFILGETK
jgi:hypothetical protein